MVDRKQVASRVVKGNKRLSKVHNGGYKTCCTSACLAHFGIDLNGFRYSQYTKDVVAILRRKGYTVRSRLSSVKRGSTVGSVRKQLSKLERGVYLVEVKAHVLLLNHDGKTIVDTDPRKRDKRKIKKLYWIS